MEEIFEINEKLLLYARKNKTKYEYSVWTNDIKNKKYIIAYSKPNQSNCITIIDNLTKENAIKIAKAIMDSRD